ncbi:Putative F-box/FBD/LRR-repeat protein At1g78840 [Linum perenne]
MKMKQQSSSKEDDDQISSLPDEILHEILYRLCFSKQAAKASSLSKRWNPLWLSYPVLEFDYRDYSKHRPSRSTMDSFIAAARRKFSSSGLNRYIKSVRIVCSKSVEFCKCNHANLKHLQISKIILVDVPDSIQIEVGAPSLESLSLSLLKCGDEIICSSLLPSLKSLHCCNLTDDVVRKLISKSPSLLSLHLISVNKVNELKIESPTLEKLELVRIDWNRQRKVLLHIDTPRLVNVYLRGHIDSLCGISDAINSFQAAQIRSATFELSLYCSYIQNRNIKELKEFLRKVTRQFQFVKLQFDFSEQGLIVWDEVEENSPTPVIERVEVYSYGQWEPLYKRWGVYRTVLDNVLWSCHPKYFSLHTSYADTDKLPSLELINKVFVERTSPNCEQIACKCWRHQLKDVKMVNIRDTKEEELMDVSADVITNLQRENQVLFKLIWH